MKAAAALLLGLALLGTGASGSSRADAPQCGLPAATPLWIDYGESNVRPDVRAVLAKPGVVVASSGTAVPAEFRKAGAATVYFVRGLPSFVGEPARPADPASIPAAAAKMLSQAQTSSACSTPIIALNELLGSGAVPPWSPTTTQYRADVLQLVQLLKTGGARPALLVHGDPYVGGTAADWWRQVSESADIVYEAYYDAPNMIRRGPVMANRRMRLGVRELVDLFGSIGVQPERLGIMLGFHSAQTPGIAGRQGLQPREAWFRVVKWEALTAREVATDERLSTVWSWGWGTFGPESVDADKADAACVWLWTRNTALCDAPAAVGPAFDTSLAEGQIVLPPRAACTFAGGNVSRAAVARLAAFTRDPRAALTAQFARASMRRAVAVSSEEVVAAEQAAIARSFHGSRSAYLQALQRRHATVQVARGAIADELRRRALPALLARTDPTQTPFGWTIARESRLADTATCRDDVLPGTGDFPASDARDVGVMPLPARLPFLFRDHAAPAAPAQPAATPKGAQITLTWTPGREADLAGYDVLRSLDGGPYTKLNAAPLQRLDYVDVLPAPAAAATYVIRARDSSGNLSPLSPSASSVDTLERARHQ